MKKAFKILTLVTLVLLLLTLAPYLPANIISAIFIALCLAGIICLGARYFFSLNRAVLTEEELKELDELGDLEEEEEDVVTDFTRSIAVVDCLTESIKKRKAATPSSKTNIQQQKQLEENNKKKKARKRKKLAKHSQRQNR